MGKFAEKLAPKATAAKKVVTKASAEVSENPDECKLYGKGYDESKAECQLNLKEIPDYCNKCKEICEKEAIKVKTAKAVATKAAKKEAGASEETSKVAKKVTGAKKEKKEAAGVNKWGHRIGTQSDLIDQAILGKGITKAKDVDAAKIGEKLGFGTSRITNHMKSLIAKNLLK